MFMLTIDTDNAAFDGNGNFNLNDEVASILKGVARSLEDDMPLDNSSEFSQFSHDLRDSNGNVVGVLNFTA